MSSLNAALMRVMRPASDARTAPMWDPVAALMREVADRPDCASTSRRPVVPELLRSRLQDWIK
jgi:hypothetical protein